MRQIANPGGGLTRDGTDKGGKKLGMFVPVVDDLSDAILVSLLLSNRSKHEPVELSVEGDTSGSLDRASPRGVSLMCVCV